MPITEEMYAIFVKDFGHRIKCQRESIGLTQVDLAQKIGTSKTTIQNYEAGNIPKGLALFKLSRILKCSIDYLLIGEESPFIQKEMAPEIPSGVNNQELIEYSEDKKYWPGNDTCFSGACLEDFDLIPMVETKLSAGGGAFVISEAVEGYYAFKKAWVRSVASSSKGLVLMRVDGNSMSPTIQDGDTVMIDTARKGIKEGHLYAIRLDSTVMVKRLAFRPAGKIVVISDNRAEYDFYEVNQTELHVLGMAIFFSRVLVRE